MKDEEGVDTKVMAVPTEKADPDFGKINALSELNKHMKRMIAHLFSYYKSLEPGKWAEVSGWESASKAQELISSSMKK
jgi:inorganic pyrophosphatase